MLIRSRSELRLRSSQMLLWVACGLMLVTSLMVGSEHLNAAWEEARSDLPSANASVGDLNSLAEESAPSVSDENVRVVRGRITDEQGRPIAGAQLWLPLNRFTSHVVSGRSDQNGNFTLRCPREWIPTSVWQSSHYLWAYAPGYDIQMLHVYKALREESEEDYCMQMLPETESRYRFVQPSGEPLQGLQVFTAVCRHDHRQLLIVPQEIRAMVSGITDADGWVTLRGVPHEKIDSIEMVSEEFGRQRQRLSVRPDYRLESIRLRPTTAIQGRIVSEHPAWGSGIRLIFKTTVDEELENTTGQAEVTTDSEGRFEVPRIAVGKSTQISVRHDQSLPVRPKLPDEFELTEGEIATLDIPLVSAPSVTGTLLSKNQTPIVNADITLFYGDKNRQSDHIMTDEHGRYSGRVLPGEFSIVLFAIPRGHARPAGLNTMYKLSAETESFEVPPIELLGITKIPGRLIDENDQPLAGKWIDAVANHMRYGGGMSDDQGNFELTVTEGMESTVTWSLEGQGIGESLTVVQRTPMILRYVENRQNDFYDAKRAAKADVTFSGRILQEGEPVANVHVILNIHLPKLQLDGTQHPNLGRSGPKVEVTTDANGRYRLDGLKAGDRCSIDIRPNFAAVDLDWPHYWQTVAENAEGVLELPDIKLQHLSQSIAGVVVDPDGNPVKGAIVIAQQRGGQSIRSNRSRPQSSPATTSDEHGHFQINELPEIPLAIFAYLDHPKAGYIRFPVKFDIERNQKDIRIVLDPSLIDD